MSVNEIYRSVNICVAVIVFLVRGQAVAILCMTNAIRTRRFVRWKMDCDASNTKDCIVRIREKNQLEMASATTPKSRLNRKHIYTFTHETLSWPDQWAYKYFIHENHEIRAYTTIGLFFSLFFHFCACTFVCNSTFFLLIALEECRRVCVCFLLLLMMLLLYSTYFW